MASRLPPLNALRAFEAAARHASFRRAASELHVSPGAVSQQVKLLEEQLGIALFRRLPRGVVLTEAGQRFGRRIGELFAGIEEATRELSQNAAAEVLTISAMASFEVSWLIPRLGSLAAAHPEITVRVLPESIPVDFASADIDLAIRYGGGHDPALVFERLLPRTIFPVCSPLLMAGPHPIRTLADLAVQTPLHEELYLDIVDATWQGWLAAVGAPGLKLRPGSSFTYSHMALQAAKAGQGVALATTVLAGDDLAAGRLVRPLPQQVESDYPYWLIQRPSGPKRAKVKVFRDWIMAEAARFLEPLPQR
jgi:LysR family glycine cleavage system transcriptional activator